MFAEVIIPLPLNAVFTYSIPPEMEGKVSVGSRVVVPFGKRKFYTGIVENITPLQPQEFEVKPIIRALDRTGHPILINPQLKLWRWIADYYMCAIGDVMRAALPAALKLESETFVELRLDSEADPTGLTEEEALIYAALLHHGKLSLADIARKTNLTNTPDRAVAALIDRGIAMVSEKVVERYRTLRKTLVSLPPEAASPGWATAAFARLTRSAKQQHLLFTLLNLQTHRQLPIEKSLLLQQADCTPAILKSLEEKELCSCHTVTINRFAPDPSLKPSDLPTLSEAQTAARNSILDSWSQERKEVTLLRGVTSSGKTEIYMHLIDRVLRSGRQVLFLVPEIALTTQLTTRLQRVFGSQVLVYHSKFSDSERVDIWRRLLDSSEPLCIIGARSSVFLPFHRLGLVIVDEEHESSYKQFDPAPRYNARDTAIVLASLHGAKTLLASASPSIETYYKAQTGKYGLVELTERYGGATLPAIEVVDMQQEWKKHGSNGPLARQVRDSIASAIARGSQAIVFHNRRGFAPIARCKACAHIPKCRNCDVSLTYHRRENNLQCHYCGSQYPLPVLCPQCGEPAIEIIGYGTERIEDEVEQALPQASVLRMDLDTTRNKDGYQEIINAFSAHKADILVGTQMVTKGLDFSDVSTVAVLNADMLVNIPDFRSAERAFNMLLQVAGRAGRRQSDGKVLIQTAQPRHPVITNVLAHDYLSFYSHELAERCEHSYPPFSRMIFIYLRHPDEATVQGFAQIYDTGLRSLLGSRVNGPETPAVARIQNLYIRRFMLKIEPEASLAKVRAILRRLHSDLVNLHPHLKSVQIHYDVDPQ